MAGVAEAAEEASGIEDLESGAEGLEGRICLRDHGMICTGQVTEIKNDCLGGADFFGEQGVAEEVCLNAILQLVFGQALESRVEGAFLNVKSMHETRGTDLLSEEESVMAISSSGIDNGIPI